MTRKKKSQSTGTAATVAKPWLLPHRDGRRTVDTRRAPEWWISTPEAAEAFLRGLKGVEVFEIGRSAESFLRAGRMLLVARACCVHGEWGGMLKRLNLGDDTQALLGQSFLSKFDISLDRNQMTLRAR